MPAHQPDDREFPARADGGGLLGATFRVLDDGRLQVETDEDSWTLDLADSHEVASLMMADRRRAEQIETTTYGVSTIGDALRELADRLDRDLPPLWLQVSLQAVVSRIEPAGRTVYPLDERRAAVDTLAAHLSLPAPDGEPDSTYGSADVVVTFRHPQPTYTRSIGEEHNHA